MNVVGKFKNYTVENFIHFITSKNISKPDFELEIKSADIDDLQKQKLLQKVQFAYNRIESPLDIQTKILLLFFPLGIINMFVPANGLFNVEKQKQLGFVKKVKQYYDYSTIGILLYIIIILVFVLM